MRTYAQKHQQSQQGKSGDPTRPSTAARSHEGHPILHMQRTMGNQAAQRRLRQAKPETRSSTKEVTHFGHDFSRIPLHPEATESVQAQLTVHPTGDIYAQEADRVTEQVMRTSELQLQRSCACGGACSECGTGQHDQDHVSLQPESVDPSDVRPTDIPPVVHEVLRSSGEPLDPASRFFMEPRFGHSFSRVSVYPSSPQSYSENLVIGSPHDPSEREADAKAARVVTITAVPAGGRADFSNVRVHTDARAAESARAVGARAYTVGDHVVFGAGRHAPQTSEGRMLLAHELTHVQQQTASGSEVMRRQPKGGEKEKADEPAAKFVGCDKDRLPVVQDAIKKAEALASRAVQAFEREYPLSYESAATTAHFGSLGSDQKSTIIARYKHVLSNLGSKTYTCAKDNKKVTEGDQLWTSAAKHHVREVASYCSLTSGRKRSGRPRDATRSAAQCGGLRRHQEGWELPALKLRE